MLSFYQSLDIEGYEIRLISLLPGPQGSMIECILEKCSLVDPPPFFALSYCWGDESITRNITINGDIVPVTVNVEDALQQLRQMNVTRIWVDALSINQSDNQEKSNQIRLMKQIYSRAQATYVWLGKQEADNTAAAIHFLRRLSSGSLFPDDVMHNHSPNDDSCDPSTPAEDEFLLQPLGGADQCERCILETSLKAMSEFCEYPYWKRRWIIQEVTVSADVQILCGTEKLELSHVETALFKFSSRAWLWKHRTAFRFLQKILYFRSAYHNGQSLQLLNTILTTRDFLSKDARDRVFAMIGICSDGPELVPAPSYYQTVEAVLRDVSRELIRKNACFDIILVDERHRSPSAALPTWVPDWLSPELPFDAYKSAEGTRNLHRSFGARSLRGGVSTLNVEGVVLGIVIDMTANLLLHTPLQIPLSRHGGHTQVNSRQQLTYYGNTSLHVISALLTCLLARSRRPKSSLLESNKLLYFRKLVKEYFDGAGHLMERNGVENHSNIEICLRWIQAHENFPFYGQSLRWWLTESPIRRWSYRRSMFRRMKETQSDRELRANMLLLLVMVTAVLPFCFWGLAKGPSSSEFWIISSVSSGIILFSGVFLSCIARAERRRLRNDMQTTPLLSQKLAIADNGMLAMVPTDAEIGDKICFIAGCTSAAVLRELRHNAGETQHIVVGGAFVCLSEEDHLKYLAFRTDADMDSSNYNQLIRDYQRRSWWEEFLLI